MRTTFFNLAIAAASSSVIKLLHLNKTSPVSGSQISSAKVLPSRRSLSGTITVFSSFSSVITLTSIPTISSLRTLIVDTPSLAKIVSTTFSSTTVPLAKIT